jgi:uncharacterized damage-inducible protein DinB
MTHVTKEHKAMHYRPNLDPVIAAALWQLEDGRNETLKAIKEVSGAALDWEHANYPNSIGTLLYHIALVEADWLYVEVLGRSDYGDAQHWFPYPARDSTGRLTPVRGMPLADHLKRFQAIRENLLAVFRTMSLEDFHREREMDNYYVTPEWVLHHLSQHEAEHRGEIMLLHTLTKASQ